MSTISEGRGRFRVVIAGVLAAVGLALAVPAGASAANVDCQGNAAPPPEGKGKAFAYVIKCFSPQGDATTVDGYSIVSNHEISGFSTDNVVTNPMTGETVSGESFACEGVIPGYGFGCFGKLSLGNEARGGFNLTRNPCSKRTLSKAGPWRLWVVASAPKVNPNTGAKTPAVSEPLNLKVPACPEATSKKK